MNKLSTYLTALLIALAGIGFLVFMIWYVVYFPVPRQMQPLKQRIIVMIQLEKIKKSDNDLILLESENESIIVYEEPDENSEGIAIIFSGDYYKELEISGEWYKIKTKEEIEGWINKRSIKN